MLLAVKSITFSLYFSSPALAAEARLRLDNEIVMTQTQVGGRRDCLHGEKKKAFVNSLCIRHFYSWQEHRRLSRTILFYTAPHFALWTYRDVRGLCNLLPRYFSFASHKT